MAQLGGAVVGGVAVAATAGAAVAAIGRASTAPSSTSGAGGGGTPAAGGAGQALSAPGSAIEPAQRLGLDGLLAFPVDTSEPLTVLNNFGARSVARGACGHQGIDIYRTDGRPGQPLLACSTGVILRLEDNPFASQGLTVVLHGVRGDVYRYHHMEFFADGLEEGDVVEVGQVIGAIGSTGNAASFAPHLHFEVRAGGDRGPAVDPVPLLLIPDEVDLGPPTGCR